MIKNCITIAILLSSLNNLISEDYSLPLLVEDIWTFYDESYTENYKFNDICFYSKLYPVGWSDDGNFAFITEKHRFDTVFFEWVVIDLVNDNVLYEKKIGICLDDISIKYDPSEQLLFEHMFGNNISEIQNELKEARIKSNSELQFFNLPYRDEKYKIDSNVNLFFNDRDLYPVLEDFEIIIEVNNKSKIIRRFRDDDFFLLVDVQVLGIIKSPYEERLAVIYSDTHHGNCQDIMLPINVTGAHLNIGF